MLWKNMVAVNPENTHENNLVDCSTLLKYHSGKIPPVPTFGELRSSRARKGEIPFAKKRRGLCTDIRVSFSR
jgi:hypothetical protein